MEISVELQQSSDSYLTQWRTLVSTTNWQKGQIICEWRQQLIDQGASATEYSDEAWSQLAEDVSSQHVGRLRRVYDRFAKTWRSYEGLYWSHFLAAYDWEDAEMWLEGALQNQWSVSQMRRQRADTLGIVTADDSISAFECVAEDFGDDQQNEALPPSEIVVEQLESLNERGLYEDEPRRARTSKKRTPRSLDEVDLLWQSQPLAELEAAPAIHELPGDFALALEQFSAVLRKHQASGWAQLPREVVLAALKSLELLIREEVELTT